MIATFAKVPTWMNRVAAPYTPASAVDASAPTSSVSSHRTPTWKKPANPRGAVKRQNSEASSPHCRRTSAGPGREASHRWTSTDSQTIATTTPANIGTV